MVPCIVFLFNCFLDQAVNGVSESLESTVLSDQADQTTLEIIPEHKVFVLFCPIYFPISLNITFPLKKLVSYSIWLVTQLFPSFPEWTFRSWWRDSENRRNSCTWKNFRNSRWKWENDWSTWKWVEWRKSWKSDQCRWTYGWRSSFG